MWVWWIQCRSIGCIGLGISCIVLDIGELIYEVWWRYHIHSNSISKEDLVGQY